MASRLFIIASVLTLVTAGYVYESNIPRTPHMCDAQHESSEECKDGSMNNLQFPDFGKIFPRNHRNQLPAFCDNFVEENCESIFAEWKPFLDRRLNRNFTSKYLLYKDPKNAERYDQLFYGNFASIKIAKPHDNTEWKILVHGYTNKNTSQFPVNVKTAYLQLLNSNPSKPFNLVVYDWGDGAKIDFTDSVEKLKFPYQHAVDNVQPAGEKLGDMIIFLHRHRFIKILDGVYNVHLIGHSLGAHVSGQAARHVYAKTNIKVKRISALDPAGPMFSPNNIFGKGKLYPPVNKNWVGYLDVYHSSEMYGMVETIGHVDFYINGGKIQPSCLKYLFKIEACSHQFAPEFFAKSVNNDTMHACTGCSSYEEYQKGHCRCLQTPVIGEFVTRETYPNGFPVASGVGFYDCPDFAPLFKRGIELPEFQMSDWFCCTHFSIIKSNK